MSPPKNSRAHKRKNVKFLVGFKGQKRKTSLNEGFKRETLPFDSGYHSYV